VICIMILLQSADNIGETVFTDLERMAGNMRPGEMRIIDMTQ